MKRESADNLMKAATEDLPRERTIVQRLIGQTFVQIIQDGAEPSAANVVAALEEMSKRDGLAAKSAKEAVLMISMAQASSDPG